VDRGYVKLDEEEAWLVVENLPDRSIPSLRAGITVTPIGPSEAGSFAEVFMAAFGMPVDFAPVLARLLQSSLRASNAHHYLAVNEGEPIGTCSLLRHERFGVLGSAGVLPGHRRSGAATNLTVKALTDARERGVDTVILQTTADAPLERLLRISGFTRAFTRSCYVLSNDFSD
jgi:ribosomal protein S18 acetylase RimI-like enzyme